MVEKGIFIMILRPSDVTLTVPAEHITRTARRLREFYSKEYDRDLPEWMIIDALGNWLEHRFEVITEDLEVLLASPERNEAHELRRYLEESMQSVEINVRPEAVPQVSHEEAVFSGNRVFSIEKLAAMAAYISSQGRDIYKTKLNKLLFYSDFINLSERYFDLRCQVCALALRARSRSLRKHAARSCSVRYG